MKISTTSAFTLIELLIVVAIIAILAAIALPNFHEAQTRAKVSRVQADLRTLGIAMECYRLDNNSYVPHKDTPADLYPLTTPIAYVSSIPADFFKDGATPVDSGANYTWQDLYEIYYFLMPTFGGGDWLARQVTAGRMWVLSSWGPDLKEDMYGNAVSPYDPTNGTTSRGDIYRVGP